ncbi:GNAT family N-acetyltransferase [Pseudoalteromonas sp. R3]|uniref:GNAT family N-acetyltransferase n=1 Tax=Pseudoalteromonas sp. R3 TaxID=1709477 RepID=UPI0009EC94F8|nr:GNAT family N-acetyltransferase [Pseudoalteromonas sp. R3]AZZ96334.1 N-acetyltransferase [Pseudoalteromonas sp. R3]
MIETPRLLLRPLTNEDWSFFLYLHQQPQVMRFIKDLPDHDFIRGQFNRRLPRWRKQQNHWLTLLIEDRQSGAPVGLHGFLCNWVPFQQAELGFMLDPSHQGKGYAKESTKAVIDFAFNECGYHKLTATVTEGNEPSFNLLTKLGFEHEGTLKDNYQLGGKWCHDQKLGLITPN